MNIPNNTSFYKFTVAQLSPPPPPLRSANMTSSLMTRHVIANEYSLAEDGPPRELKEEVKEEVKEEIREDSPSSSSSTSQDHYDSATPVIVVRGGGGGGGALCDY